VQIPRGWEGIVVALAMLVLAMVIVIPLKLWLG
jgi:hypothetical protein